jgi:Na+-transporting methylmalonyl-CoA/oxaloacetate decarboxylase gamma subunit
MDSPLATSLVLAGVGITILFLALAFLYGLVHLMTALIKDRPPAPGPTVLEGKGGKPSQEAELQAAVIAVALARAEQELRAVGAPGVEEVASSWRTLHHQRQLTLNLRTRRVR